jgi:hypothetical protein
MKHKPSFMQALQMKDQKVRKGMVFETEDFRTDELVVTCFKKVAYSNTQLRMNCFVTQFEFSRKDETEPHGINDQIETCDTLLQQLKAEQKASEDPDI